MIHRSPNMTRPSDEILNQAIMRRRRRSTIFCRAAAEQAQGDVERSGTSNWANAAGRARIAGLESESVKVAPSRRTGRILVIERREEESRCDIVSGARV